MESMLKAVLLSPGVSIDASTEERRACLNRV